MFPQILKKTKIPTYLDALKHKVANKNSASLSRFMGRDNADDADDVSVVCDSLKAFSKLDIPKRKLLLAPWLPEQGLAMVYAPRGVGKTFFALSAAYAIATGGEFLGWKAKEARRVLYIDGEMVAADMQERLKNIAAIKGNKGIDDAMLNIITPDRQNGMPIPTLSNVWGQVEFDKHVKDADLIVVDNIATLCGGIDENESRGWHPIQQWALYFRSRGKSVLFVHHSGKNGKQRGTSGREDVMDTVIQLTHPSDYSAEQGARFVVSFEKNRGFFGDEATPLEVQLKEDDDGGMFWSSKNSSESVKEKSIQLFNTGFTQTEISKELNVNRSTVSRAIKAARAEGRITDDSPTELDDKAEPPCKT